MHCDLINLYNHDNDHDQEPDGFNDQFAIYQPPPFNCTVLYIVVSCPIIILKPAVQMDDVHCQPQYNISVVFQMHGLQLKISSHHI